MTVTASLRDACFIIQGVLQDYLVIYIHHITFDPTYCNFQFQSSQAAAVKEPCIWGLRYIGVGALSLPEVIHPPELQVILTTQDLTLITLRPTRLVFIPNP